MNKDLLEVNQLTISPKNNPQLHLVDDISFKLKKGKTTVVIAHRLSTVENANKIIVMDDGQIIETGSHHELINKKSYYYNLYNSQIFQ